MFGDRLDLLTRRRLRASSRSTASILATGAMDRVLPFPGWTLPGVFTLGGAQIALKAQGVAIGRRVALVGAGPLLPLVAHQYAKAGVDVVAVLDATPFAAKLAQRRGLLRRRPAPSRRASGTRRATALRGLDVRYGVRSIRVEGDGRVEALAWRDGVGRRAPRRLRRGRRVVRPALARRSSPTSPAAASPSPPPRASGCRSADAGGPLERRRRLPRRRRRAHRRRRRRRAAGPAHRARRCSRTSAAPSIARESRALDRALARQARFRRALDAAYPFPGHLLDAIGDDEIVCRCEGITAGGAARRRRATTARARSIASRR